MRDGDLKDREEGMNKFHKEERGARMEAIEKTLRDSKGAVPMLLETRVKQVLIKNELTDEESLSIPLHETQQTQPLQKPWCALLPLQQFLT